MEEIIAQNRTRVNAQIRISPVRLISPAGEQLGIVRLTAWKGDSSP
jgi:translation initiation factor IF-3